MLLKLVATRFALLVGSGFGLASIFPNISISDCGSPAALHFCNIGLCASAIMTTGGIYGVLTGRKRVFLLGLGLQAYVFYPILHFVAIDIGLIPSSFFERPKSPWYPPSNGWHLTGNESFDNSTNEK